MKKQWLATLAFALAIPAIAQDRKTIYVEKMEGLEQFVEQALQTAELPFDFIEEQKQPELKANLAKMHSAYGEILYKHKLGRNETHRLELLDVARNKVLASYSFPLNGTDDSRRSAARAFAEKVKKAWAKQAPALKP
jgi:hypothetical protein